MTVYAFTGAFPRVLTGLSELVNAHVTNRAVPAFSTIVAEPGDLIDTVEPYAHPELVEQHDVPAPVEPVPAELAPEAPAPAPEPAPVDPAHDALTNEGAPAPTDPAPAA